MGFEGLHFIKVLPLREDPVTWKHPEGLVPRESSFASSRVFTGCVASALKPRRRDQIARRSSDAHERSDGSEAWQVRTPRVGFPRDGRVMINYWAEPALLILAPVDLFSYPSNTSRAATHAAAEYVDVEKRRRPVGVLHRNKYIYLPHVPTTPPHVAEALTSASASRENVLSDAFLRYRDA